MTAWQAFYDGTNETDPRSRGLLPLRVWQIFDAVVAALKAGDIARAVCGMGVMSSWAAARRGLWSRDYGTHLATGQRR